ncbi:hypothetical protein [Anoxybacillus suryakundensis]|uniref:Uncharacterized protein n=1 Tax=Anoxybacillus suryakundensis TaxID=1325335 RepID=A0A0K6GKZ5_9BACL|nr:hypothetical protein [Anoxybacillus suryakundensis]CUA79419.1 hypothetical protein Ga0061060_10415 [Anoxybacillus suryakundensis]
MIHRELKLFLDNKVHPLPPWIIFAFSLGAFLHEEGIKNEKSANVVVSVPNEQYFALFVAVGIADKIFSVKRGENSVRQQILSLKKGSRIIYQDNRYTRKASVLSVESSPVRNGEFILFIQDGGIRLGIPESQWKEKIILLDEEFSDIRRRRKVGKNQKLRISSPFMRALYSDEQLGEVSFYPGNNFYIIGDRQKFIEVMSEICFFINGQKGSIGEFLYIENVQKNSSYFNGKFLSPRMKKTFMINRDIPVLFSDTLSYRKQSRLFAQNPSLIVIGRSEHENHIRDVVSDVSRRIILGDTEMITSEIASYIELYGASVPNGIELLAWRERHC